MPYRDLIAAIGLLILVGLGLGLGGPLFSFRLDAADTSLFRIGINSAAGAIPVVLAAPLVPILLARFRFRRILVTVIVVAALSIVLLSQFSSFSVWLVLRFLIGSATAIAFVISEYWINVGVPPSRRGMVLGIYTTLLFLAVALGPILYLLTGHEGTFPFIVAAVIILSGLPFLLLSPGPGKAPNTEKNNYSLRSLRELVRSNPYIYVAVSVFGGIESSCLTLGALWGVQLGWSVESSAILLTAYAFGSIVFQVPIGFLSDRFNKPVLLFFVTFVAGLCFIPLPWVSDFPWSGLVGMAAAGGLSGGIYTVALTEVGERFVGFELARANAAFMTFYGLGSVAFLTIAGAMMQVFPVFGLPLLASATLLLSACVTGLYLRTRNFARPGEKGA